MSKNIKHIAVIRLSAMGDVAMTVPVIRAFTKQYPEVKLSIISAPFFEPFFEDIPNVNYVPIDVKKKYKGFIGIFKLFFDLRRLKIDAVVDLHNVIRSKFIRKLFRLIGIVTVRTNKGRAEKKALIRKDNKIFQPLKSMVERHVDTFKKVGFEVDLSNPTFPNKKNLNNNILNLTGPKTSKWIGIAPFAQYRSKIYPIDLMQKVIDDLSKNSDYKIFLFGGGEKETEILESLTNNHKNVINMASKISFKEELELISNLDVMVSMDSGNAHIAAMLGVNVITLWGATHPYAGFMPFNQPIENCLTSDRELYPLLPTSVYGNKKVPGYDDVMRTILPSKVVEKIQNVIKQ